MTEQTRTARSLWMELRGMSPDSEREYLEQHELFVDGAWRVLSDADKYVHPNSPLLLFDESVQSNRMIPMDEEIRIRRRSA